MIWVSPDFLNQSIFHIKPGAFVVERASFVMRVLCLVDWTSDCNVIRMRTFYIWVGFSKRDQKRKYNISHDKLTCDYRQIDSKQKWNLPILSCKNVWWSCEKCDYNMFPWIIDFLYFGYQFFCLGFNINQLSAIWINHFIKSLWGI